MELEFRTVVNLEGLGFTGRGHERGFWNVLFVWVLITRVCSLGENSLYDVCTFLCNWKKKTHSVLRTWAVLYGNTFHVFATYRHMWMFTGLDMKLGNPSLNPDLATVKCVTLDKYLTSLSLNFFIWISYHACKTHRVSLCWPLQLDLPTLCSFSKLQSHWPPFCSFPKQSLV